MKLKGLVVAAVLSGMLSGQVYAGANEAARIGSVARKAQNLVRKVLSSAGRPNPGMGQPGSGIPGGGMNQPRPGNPGGGFGGGINLPWLNQNDMIAAPIFVQASDQFNIATNYAFESQAAFSSGNIQLAVFKFTTACSRLAIGKSALARANLATFQPPYGSFTPFHSEIMAVLNEIENARQSNGCP